MRGRPSGNHDHGATFAARRNGPIAREDLTDFVQAQLSGSAPGLLRFKGVFDVAGQVFPVVLQAVQDVFHDADLLERWPDEDRSSRFVVILKPSDQRERYARLIAQSGLGWEISGPS